MHVSVCACVCACVKPKGSDQTLFSRAGSGYETIQCLQWYLIKGILISEFNITRSGTRTSAPSLYRGIRYPFTRGSLSQFTSRLIAK